MALDVLAGGPGFVAVGSDGATPGRGLVWTSAAGLTWSPVPDQPAFQHVGIAGVAGRDGAIVAVGRDTANVDVDEAAVLRSSDGLFWTRLPAQEAFAGVQLTDVAATDIGFVAVGSVLSGPGSDSAAVLTSPDGRQWTRVEQAAFAHAFMWGVASSRFGIHAVGWRATPSIAAAAWLSIDGGRSWQLTEVLPAGTGFELNAVVPGIDRVVAGGDWLDGGGIGVWATLDGLHWARADPRELGSGTMSGLAEVDGTFIGVGNLGYLDAAAWASDDGLHWSRIDGSGVLEGAFLEDIAVSLDHVVAVGAVQLPVPGTLSAISRAQAWVADR